MIFLFLEDSEGIEDYKSQPPDLSTANYSGQNQVNSIPQHMNMDIQNVGYINNQFQKVKSKSMNMIERFIFYLYYLVKNQELIRTWIFKNNITISLKAKLMKSQNTFYLLYLKPGCFKYGLTD